MPSLNALIIKVRRSEMSDDWSLSLSLVLVLYLWKGSMRNSKKVDKPS